MRFATCKVVQLTKKKIWFSNMRNKLHGINTEETLGSEREKAAGWNASRCKGIKGIY